ncbi:MAG TPA: alpha/beta fold hydrolase [Acidimicrobiales bacterium]|nr:alpha/beta fold hydrolase [Acidimicrobiales bacterium]
MGARTQYLDVDGDAVAYQVFGQGPDLTFVLGLSSHVDLRWSVGSVRRNLEALGSFARVISFDRRGTGASERLSTDRLPTWEDWADDLRHVLDSVGSTRTWLLAALDGGPYALIFAAAHPDRVHGLILANTGAKYRGDPTFAQGVPAANAEAVLEAIEHGWGTDAFAALTASDDPSEHAALAVLQRASASPSLAAAQFRMVLEADFRDVAAAVRVPTVVFHRVDHPFVPVTLGRDLARRIAGAEFVELPGGRGLLDGPDRTGVVARIAELVTGMPAPPTDDRRLAAVLFTDIVASTEQVHAIGDGGWRGVLDEHDSLCARHVDAHRGRVVRYTGDGMLAVFDRPSQAVLSALELSDALAAAGTVIRAGVHVGEIEIRGDDIAGISVHIAQRIQDAAPPREVFVSRTVVDLTAGAGITSAERGVHVLKGVPGEWPLFAATR